MICMSWFGMCGPTEPKGLFFPALGQDVEFGMIILTVVKPDDILMAPVMVVQKRLITARRAGADV